ncbi:MAG TPA: hypothetical protein VIG64_06345, partial [Actinomycetota bacterium]
SWTLAATADRWNLTSVLPNDGGALVGTGEAHLQQLHGEGLETVASFEDVAGREDWFTPWGGPPDVRSMAQAGEDVFVNVHVGGIVRGDGRSGWQPTLDIGNDVHEVIAVDGRLMAACAVGFAESEDRGKTWTFDDDGLHATYARAVAASAYAIYMSVAQGPRGGDAAVYRKERVAGATFERCDLPSFPHNIDTGCLAATEDLVAFGTREGDLFALRGRDAIWETIGSGYAEIRHVAIVP